MSKGNKSIRVSRKGAIIKTVATESEVSAAEQVKALTANSNDAVLYPVTEETSATEKPIDIIGNGTATETDATKTTETETVPPVAIYAPSIKSFSDIEALDAETKKKLLVDARTSARSMYGTSAEPQRDTETGAIRRDKRGYAIPQYTPRRPADTVAADELERLQRLPWATDAANRCKALAAKEKRNVTEGEIQKALSLANPPMPKSYKKGIASNLLYGRVLQTMRDAGTYKGSNE